ncbi:MAG: Hg(II)-responsive transcriptional regulator [Piscirickettsiaceae bacterium]|nr:MAG: Hg(II)-responsive transcriptional regulator [Piscirickettsiaceae bacterium]
MNTLTIGLLAKTAGINVETIRYYQRIHLIDQPEKPALGYRVYPDKTLNRIRFIKRAQLLGFSLEEIAQLLEISDEQCETAAQMGLDKLHIIQTKISDLTKMASVLEEYTQQCAINADHSHCPLIDTLIDKDN